MMSRTFANAKSLQDDGLLDHLLDIYVTRNFSLWKVNDVQTFLLQGAQLAANSPTLFSAHPQVLKLREALHKYQRAVASGKQMHLLDIGPRELIRLDYCRLQR